jgi:hypothetical protein
LRLVGRSDRLEQAEMKQAIANSNDAKNRGDFNAYGLIINARHRLHGKYRN